MSRFLLSVLILAMTYALVLGSFAPWNILIGTAVSGTLILLYRQFLFGGRPRPLPDLPRRLLAFIPFTWAVFLDIVKGTWTVALIVLHLRPLVRPGIVAVPIEERTRNGVAVSTLVFTLSPGSYLVDVDWERRLMLFHVIDACDPEAIRAKYHYFYYRYQRHVFP